MKTPPLCGLLLLLAACRPAPPPPASNPGILSVAWVQAAGERTAQALQAYRLARERVEQALADPTWSADLEQLAAGGYQELPPAVILDVDETVLDNSPYQARLIRDNAVHSSERWAEWVADARAAPLAGAREFTSWAAEQGIRVVYLTNRDSEQEEATRRNLIEAGCPVDEDDDAVLTRGEVEGGSDKAPRRGRVAASYRVLVVVGDDLNDFVAGTRADVATRNAVMLQHGEFWGRRWIVLANPMYGGWESALAGDALAEGAAERIAGQLETMQ